MRSMIVLGVWLVVSTFHGYSVALAQAVSSDVSVRRLAGDVGSGRDGQESWYIYLGLGYAHLSYPGELDEAADALSGFSGVTHVPLAADVGIYMPIANEPLLLGITLSEFVDVYASQAGQLRISGTTMALSTKVYLGGRVARGLFLRTDLGPTQLMVAADNEDDVKSDIGTGFLLGTGYVFPVSDGSGLVFSANYAFRYVERQQYGALSITVGGLF